MNIYLIILYFYNLTMYVFWDFLVNGGELYSLNNHTDVVNDRSCTPLNSHKCFLYNIRRVRTLHFQDIIQLYCFFIFSLANADDHLLNVVHWGRNNYLLNAIPHAGCAELY